MRGHLHNGDRAVVGGGWDRGGGEGAAGVMVSKTSFSLHTRILATAWGGLEGPGEGGAWGEGGGSEEGEDDAIQGAWCHDVLPRASAGFAVRIERARKPG